MKIIKYRLKKIIFNSVFLGIFPFSMYAQIDINIKFTNISCDGIKGDCEGSTTSAQIYFHTLWEINNETNKDYTITDCDFIITTDSTSVNFKNSWNFEEYDKIDQKNLIVMAHGKNETVLWVDSFSDQGGLLYKKICYHKSPIPIYIKGSITISEFQNDNQIKKLCFNQQVKLSR